MPRSASTYAGSAAVRKRSRSWADMGRTRVRVEKLDAAADAAPLCRRGHAVTLLAEDHPLAWRVHLPHGGEVTVLPAVAEELAHRRLMFRAGEERVSIGC